MSISFLLLDAIQQPRVQQSRNTCNNKSCYKRVYWKQRSVLLRLVASEESLFRYHIRPLQRHEIFQFTNICNECFHTYPLWKWLLRPLFFLETFLGLLLLLNRKEAEEKLHLEEEPDEVLVAQDETTGKLVGVVQLSTIPQGSEVFQAFKVQKGKIPYVYNLAVLPPVRRRGIGRRLLQKCEEIVRERKKYSKIGLHSIVGNDRAERLYQSLGYSKKGSDPFWVTFLWMTRRNYWEKELN